MITEQLSWNNVIHENSLAVTTPLSHIILYADDDKSQQSKTPKAGWYALAKEPQIEFSIGCIIFIWKLSDFTGLDTDLVVKYKST